MAQQMKLTSFFGKRKRIPGDEAVLRQKKLLLDGNIVSHHDPSQKCNDDGQTTCSTHEQKINGATQVFKKPLSEGVPSSNRNEENVGSQIKKPEAAINKIESGSGPGQKQIDPNEVNQPKAAAPVTFKLMGSLSPTKKSVPARKRITEGTPSVTEQPVDKLPTTPKKQIMVAPSPSVVEKGKKVVRSSREKNTTEDVIKSAKELVNRIKETRKEVENEEQQKKNFQRRELSLKEVKDKLKQSSKLHELKKSINKINEQAALLIELENRKKENSVPKLSKFKVIEVDVPLSPQKNALYSPSKVERSPAKSAYERYNYLSEAITTLPLPFGFQKLYELFRAVDTVIAMLMNRGEDTTFSKLKPAVQEMTRKNFTQRHLGQMAAVLPSAFKFHQEKIRNYGSTSKSDRYDLMITPTFPDSSEARPYVPGEKGDRLFHSSDRMSMTPKITKARREAFYNALLDKTKDCHEEFLKSLDPPMHINRNDLKRWHPNFMVDHVPDIVPIELPQPPDIERPATAKEVLERAKDFLSSNARLQKALEAASQSSIETQNDITPEISPAIKEKVDSRLTNPLKGISKSLLERVRARQAAKALDSMRMTPQQEKETVMHARLPAIARIVRTLFVNEQRGVLSWETVIEKVQFSYNRSFSKGDIESHVKLLVDLLPEWLSMVHIRNASYLKMNASADLPSAMSKLEKIVSEKVKNT